VEAIDAEAAADELLDVAALVVALEEVEVTEGVMAVKSP
jgi:hypothetical protein